MIKSLLELQEEKRKLSKEFVRLMDAGLTDTREFANVDWNLRSTQKAIDSWGTEQAVYRIC